MGCSNKTCSPISLTHYEPNSDVTWALKCLNSSVCSINCSEIQQKKIKALHYRPLFKEIDRSLFISLTKRQKCGERFRVIVSQLSSSGCQGAIFHSPCYVVFTTHLDISNIFLTPRNCSCSLRFSKDNYFFSKPLTFTCVRFPTPPETMGVLQCHAFVRQVEDNKSEKYHCPYTEPVVN